MNILIVDDHAILRKGIRSILDESPMISIVREAKNGHEAIRQVRQHSFDIVLLDISMPGKDGMDTLKQLKYEQPDLRILMLTMHPEEHYALRSLKAGAAGYLRKDCSAEELLEAIRAVQTKGKYISPAVAMTIANAIDSTTGGTPHEKLSDREVQVMRLLAAASTVNEIADELAISAKTVATYKARILEKLHLKNTAELIRYAIENEIA